ncbi:MAG: hypothetical protein HOV80_32630, partial [Polyangiaceae bacterium]|nr:hypothetical protein [Polyangiaceae bacterium]
LIGGCGAQVVFEASDETDPPPRATTEPETPDPCAAFTSHKACCEADCHLILVPGPFAFACLSEERDCARHPEVCTPDETCEVHDTPGDGGCSYGLDADSVGRCVPR